MNKETLKATASFGKELFIRFSASAFRKLPSIYVFSYFPFGFEGRMWDLIVSGPDNCLSFYFGKPPDTATHLLPTSVPSFDFTAIDPKNAKQGNGIIKTMTQIIIVLTILCFIDICLPSGVQIFMYLSTKYVPSPTQELQKTIK